MKAHFALLSALLVTGCTAAPASDPGGNPPGNPTRHDLAANSALVVPAREVHWHTFTTPDDLQVGYRLSFSDGSAADVGFVLESDLAEFEQGQSVQAWGFQQNTLGTSQEVVVPAGAYAFVVRCNNDFLDCDGSYDLWAIY